MMNALLPIFAISVQFVFYICHNLPCDFLDVTNFYINAFGLLMLAFALWKKEIKFLHWIVFGLIALYPIIRGLFGFVHGYTIFEMLKLFGICGIVLATSQAKQESVWKALLVVGLIQIVVTYGHLIDWKDAFNYPMNFGTVRSSIRYSTLILASLFASYELIVTNKWRVLSIISLPIQLVTLFHAYSNTIIALTVLCAAIFAIVHFKSWKLPLVALILMCVIGYHFDTTGFNIDKSRLLFWSISCRGWTSSPLHIVFGNGLGSWQLLAGIYCTGLPWHPHNELLRILFETGAIGGILASSLILFVAYISQWNLRACILFLAISASFLTNSLMMYPDMVLLWSIALGLAISKEISICE